ncbi:MAG: hypoxanthine phosphoribosyltransferase [Prevotellaceae bacterium]|jgi:hypoxanthine phosphoribosyltransferase|nr:hypoxanthine phosphoribosyltransferase [Prevotellaceae bacterium]
MRQITLHDKTFEISIPEEKILEAVKQIAEQLNNDLKDVDKPIFISVLNGSFMFTADLMKHIEQPCEVSFLKLSSYSGTESSGTVKELIGLTKSIKGRTAIILEDIVDSGKTLEELINTLHTHKPKEVKLATLLFKPDTYKKDIKLDYIGLSIPNDFIVGYGLDYDELGRNLRDIYTLVE